MSPRILVRRGAAARVVTVCALSTGALVLPTLALAADSGGNTIVAAIGSNGAVKSVKQVSLDGGTSSFTGKLPVEMTISQSSSGGNVTYTYHVENTWSQQQTVNYVDTAGKPHHTSLTLQLPLVAQLGVTLPSTMKNVSATGATVTTDASGAKRLLWNMVLFTPLGSASNDVAFTASGTGTPLAELRATAVDPGTTPGLSASGQAATASFQQDDFWNGYAGGGNDGLTKLRDGVAQMVTGLQQLHDGIAQAQGGAVKLDDGTRAAYVGSRKLNAGLGKISVGADDLSTGLGKIHTGQSALTGGLTKIHSGQASLTTGIGQIHTGQSALTTGLAQLSGGLAQMADPTTGLQAGVVGLQQINTGIGALLLGVGSDTAANTLINGVDQIIGGLQGIEAGFTGTTGINTGMACSIDVINVVTNGAGAKAGTTDPCFFDATLNPSAIVPALPGLVATDATSAAFLNGVLTKALTPMQTALTTQIEPGLTALENGAKLVRGGLSHAPGTTGPTDQGGVKEGLLAIQAGLAQLLDPTKGLPAAVAGATALSNGAAAALAGSQQLTDGSAAALAGSQQLTDGSAAALAGSQQLTDGSGKAYTGSKQLAGGAGQAFTGSKSLVSGLGQLSAGQHQVATGLPAAVSGTAQLLDGAKQVHDGIGQVQAGAVEPLNKQLQQASQNSHQQVAVLSAAAALADKAPGGAHTSYVLSQDTHGFRLAAASGIATTSAGHTARNVGVGLGGFALLILGVFGGFAAGRRSNVTV